MVEIQGVKFHNAEETSKLLGISSRTLSRWTTDPDRERPKYAMALRPYVAPNGKKLFREQDILATVSACLGMEVSVESLEQLPELVHA